MGAAGQIRACDGKAGRSDTTATDGTKQGAQGAMARPADGLSSTAGGPVRSGTGSGPPTTGYPRLEQGLRTAWETRHRGVTARPSGESHCALRESGGHRKEHRYGTWAVFRARAQTTSLADGPTVGNSMWGSLDPGCAASGGIVPCCSDISLAAFRETDAPQPDPAQIAASRDHWGLGPRPLR